MVEPRRECDDDLGQFVVGVTGVVSTNDATMSNASTATSRSVMRGDSRASAGVRSSTKRRTGGPSVSPSLTSAAPAT
jgi:hypothetical protein